MHCCTVILRNVAANEKEGKLYNCKPIKLAVLSTHVFGSTTHMTERYVSVGSVKNNHHKPQTELVFFNGMITGKALSIF